MLGILKYHLDPVEYEYVTESVLSRERAGRFAQFVKQNKGWKKSGFTKRALTRALVSEPQSIWGLIRRIEAQVLVHDKFLGVSDHTAYFREIQKDKEILLYLRRRLDMLKDNPVIKASVMH
ncbi:MAG: hypothetical protein V1835_01065 [Candidatus Micrarchaeota archaeon]